MFMVLQRLERCETLLVGFLISLIFSGLVCFCFVCLCVLGTTMGLSRWLYLSFVMRFVDDDDDAIRISMDYGFKNCVVMMLNSFIILFSIFVFSLFKFVNWVRYKSNLTPKLSYLFFSLKCGFVFQRMKIKLKSLIRK